MKLAKGVHSFNDFAAPDQDGVRKFMIVSQQSIVGAGRGDDGSRLRMRPYTSKRKTLVPHEKGTTNPLSLIEIRGGKQLKLSGFSLFATPQGHLYNGIRLEKSKRVEVSELLVWGVPGNSDINPGETFAINDFGGFESYYHDIEVNGADVGASGIGFNGSTGGKSVSVTAHDLRYCKGWALWKHKAGHVFNECESLNNAFGWGFEQSVGDYVLNDCKFTGSTRADIHLANNVGRAYLTIHDPKIKAPLKVLIPDTELGKPNKQRPEDVRLFVDGKRRDDLLTFVKHA